MGATAACHRYTPRLTRGSFAEDLPSLVASRDQPRARRKLVASHHGSDEPEPDVDRSLPKSRYDVRGVVERGRGVPLGAGGGVVAESLRRMTGRRPVPAELHRHACRRGVQRVAAIGRSRLDGPDYKVDMLVILV